MQQLLAAFRRLGGVLRGVLAPAAFVDTVAALVQAVCGSLIGALGRRGHGPQGGDPCTAATLVLAPTERLHLLPPLPPLPPSNACVAAAEDILSLPDISVDESEQIPRILEPLTSGVADALLPPAPAGSASGGPTADDLAAALHERTPAVMKLRVRGEGWGHEAAAACTCWSGQVARRAAADSLGSDAWGYIARTHPHPQELCELLDIRLVEIRGRWAEGRLQALGFRCGWVGGPRAEASRPGI